MKAKLLVTLEAGPTAPDEIVTFDGGKRFIMAGTVIEHPDCWKLCRGGFAAAADDQCEERMKAVPNSQLGIARAVHDRILRERDEFIAEMEAEELDDESDT